MQPTVDATTALERPTAPLLRRERDSAIDFGGLDPQYHPPMHYPTEVELYEPTLDTGSIQRRSNEQETATVSAEVPLPCGHFNIWRPLHDRRVPVAARLARFFTGSAALQSDGRVVAPASSTWDSRISYSSADDEYFENGHALPLIKGWEHGMLASRNIFRKIEHDWQMTYLAPSLGNADQQSLAVWRFNYAESRRAIERFHAVLGFSLFAETAGVEWCIRPLSKRCFRQIPIRILTAEETAYFPEIELGHDQHRPASGRSLDERARIIEQYRGQILAYRARGDDFNSYIVHSVPALAADLSAYVEGEYGFELAVSFLPATEGRDVWQKVQVARQSLRQLISGRLREGEDALAQCGLDFRIKLRNSIVVPPVAPALIQALTAQPPRLQMDDARCDFTIHVRDPENTVGSLQPPIRAHESVLRAGSEYFAALLESEMAEAASKHVELDAMPYGAVRLAICFLYADEVPHVDAMDLSDWITLLSATSRLSIPRLHQLCQARILREVAYDPLDIEHDPSYKDLVTYPDTEVAESLQAVADDSDAQDLVQALDRLIAYYPIAVCENRIRSRPAQEFSRSTAPPFFRDDPRDHPEAMLGGPPLGPFGHGIGDEADEWALMPGPVLHPEIIPDIRHARHIRREHPRNGFFARHLGNWLPFAPNGDADPPAPQPGPVPEAPRNTHRPVPQPESGSESDDGSAPGAA
ncbi:protein modification by small protein conjugation or removal [Coemansia sp. RSA 2610]|nr:protein modification by small protein conjugation or removal [Coemansia sp. RSA 2610]